MDWRVRSVAQILVLGCLLAVTECGTAEQRVVCYYTNWSVYRPGTAKFSPQNINPYLCTHLIYAFGGFTKDNALKPFDKYQDIEKGGYAKFTGLKTYNKNLKTMLAIGGWNEGSSRFSPMVADPERRKQFVKNSIKFLRQNHFDGLDLDWEYPAFRDGGKPRDRDNYASLVQELREAYEREASKTGRPRLLLSMAVPAGIEYIDKGYDVPKLNKYLDFINLLSYDYHSSYEPAVNHHSPLYPLEDDNEYNFDTELTVDYTIKHLLESGASADKIVLGIPTYGRSYTLFNEDATDIGSPADGPGEEGDATREKGYLAYYEICEGLIDSDEWEVISPNPNAMGPYAFKGNQWVGYDDEAIVRLKAQYVSEQGLGGIMFWSIDNDDFRGKCHNRPYPLIEAAKEAMLAGGDKTSVKEKSTRPSKTRTDSNFIGRKLGAGRRRTTETPAVVRQENSRKRVNSLRSRSQSKNRENSEEEETQVQVNARNRGQFFDSEEDEDTSNNSKIGSNSVRNVEDPEDQEEEPSRTRNTQSRRRKLQGNRRRSTTVASVPESSEERVGNSRITTPEPPTTPDPGTDFKCEDEGFFSHPRDCKKYFWCLDAGPGGLGIVAHHFTCPAGLVFNKAADSCDYPRNVVCPKTKTAETPATRAPIIAATSRTTRIQSTTRRSATTSTTTEPSEYSDEYEYYDDEEEEKDDVPITTTTTTTARTLQYKTISRNRPSTTTTEASTTTTQIPKSLTSRLYQSIPSRGNNAPDVTSIEDSEEDPKVIQELIELIKKAGGIEELEKQLHLQGKGSESSGQTGSATNKDDVTPATISRSLYERVLNRQATNGGTTLFRRTTTVPPTTVTTEIPKRSDSQESSSQESKPSFRNGPGQAQFEGLDDIPEVKSIRRGRPQYVTINRQRPSTPSPVEDSEEEIAGDNTDGVSSEAKLISNPVEPTPSTQRKTPGYVEITRSRTSTARTNVLEDEDEEEDEDVDDEDRSEEAQTSTETVAARRRNQSPIQEEPSSTTSRYVTIQRVRSTTQATEETSSEDDRQISKTTTQSSNSPTEIAITANSDDEIDDKISVPETSSTNETETEQSVPLHSISTTETPNLVSADLGTENIDPSTTLLPITVKLVEESSTPATSTIIYSSSTQEYKSDEELGTKESTTVAQPRPFGFQRRTRPTTTSTLTPSLETTTASVNSDSGRVKVPSETVRLPTLKELIGYNTIVAHDYTSTTPITLSIKNSLDADNAINTSEYNTYLSETIAPIFEKELLSEEIESTKATVIKQEGRNVEEDQSNGYPSLETAGNNDFNNGVGDNSISHLDIMSVATASSSPATLPIRILKQDKMPSRRRKVKLVNVPVRILESDKLLTEVVLEVPEYKLNSVLRSLLRVEIINDDNATNNNSDKSKDINTYSQRRRYNANQNYGKNDSTEERESNELLSKDANTNFIRIQNSFTSTTPSVSTLRGSRLVTPLKSRNRGFYVTKSIESNTLYEGYTTPTTSQFTELDNELTQRFSTTTEQLSTPNNDQSTITTGNYYTGEGELTSQQFSTTTQQLSTTNETPSTIAERDYYTGQQESATERTWPSIINTSLENFNNILANNADIDSAAFVTQKTTASADTTSTEYFATSEIVDSVNSATEPASTESYDKLYTSNSGEAFRSYSTDDFGSTNSEGMFEPDSNSDIHSITSATEINTNSKDVDYYLASTTAKPQLQLTTINQNTDSTTDSSIPHSEITSTATSATDVNTISEDLDYSTAATVPQKTEGNQNTDFTTDSTTPVFEATSFATSATNLNTINEDLDYSPATIGPQKTRLNQNTSSTTDSSTPGAEATSTATSATEVNTISEDLDYSTATTGRQKTRINQNTGSTTDSSTPASEATSTATSVTNVDTISEDLDYSTATTGRQKTRINQNTGSTTDNSTPASEATSTATSVTNVDIISEDLDYSTATTDRQRTTSNQYTNPFTESSTSSSEATRPTTGFNFNTESSSTPDLEKTTVSDFGGPSDTTKFFSSETSTSDLESTVPYTGTTGFTTDVNPSTESISIESTSDFVKTTVTAASNSDFKSSTILTDDNSVPQTTTTDFTSAAPTSVYNPDVQSTTISNPDLETSTLDFETSSVSIDSTISDVSTTLGPFTTVADATETVYFTENHIGTTSIEVKTTTSSGVESTTESGSTVAIPIYATQVNEAYADSRTAASPITDSESNTTGSPSINASEITPVSTTTRKEEAVNQILEIPKQAQRRPFVPAQSNDSALPRRGFYKSPTAIPGKKNERRRIIRKRIYGIRRPYVEAVPQNETDNNITAPNANDRSNATNKPRQRFVRRRIINHTTGNIVDEVFKRNLTDIRNRNTASNSNPELVQKINDTSKINNNLAQNLLRHRAIYRHRPRKNETNSSIEANISSQNNSASNDVQSSSVSSTDSNQRRRIVVQRFRYRGSGLVKSTTVSPSPSPQSILAENSISQLNSNESPVEKKSVIQEDKRKTSGQDYTDVTNDNLSSGSESYGRVSVFGREELPRTESISEAMNSGDEQADEGEINLFKTRTSNPRKPGTLLRQTRPTTSTSAPENEIATTISPSTKLPNNIAKRRRFRLGQRPATQAAKAGAESEAAPGDGETLKSEANERILESLDQTGHAQEVEATVAVADQSTPASPVSTGRAPFRTSIRRRIVTTEAPQVTVSSTLRTIIRQRQRPNPFDKISENTPARPRRPAIIDYDYYEDSEERIVGKSKLSEKISFTARGSIRCLDQGNFPHPTSCKKFITCARMVNGQVIGTEYTCPKRLSYDPVGGICNWSAGLGCKE